MGLKITFVMPWHISERGGGAEVQANYLAQELVNRKFQVTYVCQTVNNDKIGKSSKVGNLMVKWLKPSRRFQWLDQKKYYNELRELEPDIIIQRLSSNVSYVIGKYSNRKPCKFIWICTDNKSPFKDFHMKKFRASYSMKKIGFLKYCIFWMNSLVMDFFRNLGMQAVDIAFTQNNFQKQALLKEFKIHSERMISGHKIPPEILTKNDRFAQKTILWCGNLGKNKRPELFIELARRFTDESYRFIMVGGHADEKYKEVLFHNKPDNISIIGQVSFEESLEYFNTTTLLVNTSISEGFSNTYIQAWVRGIPTLVFGADPDKVIENNSLGFSVKDLNEAEEKMRRILIDVNLYIELSRNASLYGKTNHSISKMTDHFLKSVL